MRLRRIQIEGFRAIRRLDLELDDLTAVIGENGFGRTSLLDALMSCLGAGTAVLAFAADDFHAPPPPEAPVDRIRIVLTFIETRPGERRATPALAAALVGPDGAGLAMLQVEATRGDEGPGPCAVTFCAPDGAPLRPQPPPEALAALRERCPAVVLRAGRYFVGPTRAPGAPVPLTADLELEHQVLHAYAKLAHGWDLTAPDMQAGVAAARQIVARVAERLAARAQPRTTRLLEALAQAPGARGPVAPGTLHALGGAAQGLAALLLLGGLFRANGAPDALGDADPILVIEDPEANLHPVVAANVSRLIDALPVQRLVTTNSGDLLASIPLWSLRRAVREADGVRVFQVARRALSVDEQRRVGYHVRANRADALFARCWLLVEGETEFWLVPELARILGYDLPSEGVRVVEFAQCGVEPLVKLAQALGIAWHLLADGDEAGRRYAARARELAAPGVEAGVTLLEHQDVEHCFFAHGFEDVFLSASGIKPRPSRRGGPPRGPAPTKVIARAIDERGKPRLALEVLEALSARGLDAVPPPLRALVEGAVRLARG
ncbi:MAG: DUF2813 domain-containing protein [Planctomycetes bacterium]|nr:DUF2813 domain-containing protein [Planctomycetota bacterium]